MALAIPSLLSTALLFLTYAHLTTAQKDNAAECSCFLTSGPSSSYFSDHRFHDFRNVVQSSASIPSLIPSSSSSSNASATSDFFTGSAWNADWSVQNWNNSDSIATNNASILMINSPNNVYIETSTDNVPDYTTYLTLRTSRLPTFQSAAEVDSTEQNFQFLSARFLARVTGSPGACAGLFTYLSSNPVQESDIEILTAGPRNMVQYTNQPSVDAAGNAVSQATVNASIPGGKLDWTVWNTYRMDWLPKQTSWYVNNVSVANISYQVPKSPSGLILNMWSDGGEWTGNMSTYDEAFLQIQWIQIVYNTSGAYAASQKRDEKGVLEKRKGTPGCRTVCSVDEEVNVTGTPAVLYSAAARGGLGSWVAVLLLGALVFGFL